MLALLASSLLAQTSAMLTSVFSLLFATVPLIQGAHLQISTSGGNASSPLLYGVLFEDVYHSGDGGLYGEMIQNRAFQGTTVHLDNDSRVVPPFENLEYYQPIGSVNLTLDDSNPISGALPYHMRLDILSPNASSNETVGFYNEGYWGLNVTTSTSYKASFYLRGTYSGVITAAFVRNTTGETLSGVAFDVSQSGDDGWVRYEQEFIPWSSAPDQNNWFQLTFDPSKANGPLSFQLISLFQQTYKGRDNGLRLDLAEDIAGLNGKLLRFPGGNNLEGQSSPYHLKWNETIGPLTDRPGFPGTWGWINTNGFGLLEMMQMTLDMDLTPVLAVWGGLYLDGETVPQDELQPWIDDALNELEFLMGGVDSTYGSMRAALGYPEPFDIPYVEVGNEDYLNNGTGTYTDYRFKMFAEAINARYPDIKVISSVYVGEYSHPPPTGTIQDLHDYLSVSDMVSKFGGYDNAPRDYPVLVGEYAAIYDDTHQPPDQLNDPTLQSAMSEAIYFLGLERNADVIMGICHGALIKSLHNEPGNVAMMKQSPTAIVHSYSYYIAKLFGNYYGTFETVPITSDTAYGPLYWAGTKDQDETYYIKVVNFNGTASTPVTVNIPKKSADARLVMVSGPSGESTNVLDDITSVWEETTVHCSGDGDYSFTLSGPYIAAVLVVA